MSAVIDLMDRGFSSGRCPVTQVVSPNIAKAYAGFEVSFTDREQDHYGGPTTAIVLQGRVFFILNDNHARGLDEAAQAGGLQGVIGYFIDHIALANVHSEHRMAVGLCDDPFALYPTTLEVLGRENIERVIEAATANQA